MTDLRLHHDHLCFCFAGRVSRCHVLSVDCYVGVYDAAILCIVPAAGLCYPAAKFARLTWNRKDCSHFRIAAHVHSGSYRGLNDAPPYIENLYIISTHIRHVAMEIHNSVLRNRNFMKRVNGLVTLAQACYSFERAHPRDWLFNCNGAHNPVA
ncbi:hypothetical protein BDR05DRAFT_109305 [Suillus weaverae]|nr:hypothetical protein BDR05DRAFT_109305 [Suillus weaverae]